MQAAPPAEGAEGAVAAPAELDELDLDMDLSKKKKKKKKVVQLAHDTAGGTLLSKHCTMHHAPLCHAHYLHPDLHACQGPCSDGSDVFPSVLAFAALCESQPDLSVVHVHHAGPSRVWR